LFPGISKKGFNLKLKDSDIYRTLLNALEPDINYLMAGHYRIISTLYTVGKTIPDYDYAICENT
jgi:hypothetical protein